MENDLIEALNRIKELETIRGNGVLVPSDQLKALQRANLELRDTVVEQDKIIDRLNDREAKRSKELTAERELSRKLYEALKIAYDFGGEFATQESYVELERSYTEAIVAYEERMGKEWWGVI